MRTSSQRLNKYSAKLSGVVVSDRMEKYGASQKSNFEASSAKMAEVEQKVKAILNKSGTPPLLNHHYMNYGKKILRLNDIEASIAQSMRYKTGMNSAILYEIGKVITSRKLPLTPYDMLLYLHFDNDSNDYSGYGNNAVSADPHFCAGVIQEGIDTSNATGNTHQEEYWNEYDGRARHLGAVYNCTYLKVTDRYAGKTANGYVNRSAGSAEYIDLPDDVEVTMIEAAFKIAVASQFATDRYRIKQMLNPVSAYMDGLGCQALYDNINSSTMYLRTTGWNIVGWTPFYNLGASAITHFLSHPTWFGVAAMSNSETDVYFCSMDNSWLEALCSIRITYRDRYRMFKVPNSADFNLTERISVAAWIKPTDTAEFEGIIDKGWAYATGAWGLQRTGRQVTWALAIPVSFVTATAVDILNLNEWNFIVGTYEKTTGKLRLYVNGTLAAETTYITAIQTNSMDIYIGDAHISGVAFEGAIDEVRIWNRALEAQEISEMYSIEKNLMGI